MKKYALILLLLVLFVAKSFSQNDFMEMKMEIKKPKYISISDVIVAPAFFFESAKSDYYAGYKYRAIVTISEIYASLYIEKITLDIEGSNMEIEWSRKVKILDIFDAYQLSQETTQINDIKWLDVDSFTFLLGDMKFVGKISDIDKLQVTKCKNN